MAVFFMPERSISIAVYKIIIITNHVKIFKGIAVTNDVAINTAKIPASAMVRAAFRL